MSADETKVLDPSVADVFTAMFKQSEATTNQVFENYEQQIAQLKSDYTKLWESVDRANEFVDSQRIGNILAATEWKYSRAAEGQVAS